RRRPAPAWNTGAAVTLRARHAVPLLGLALLAAGCGGGSPSGSVTVQPAHTIETVDGYRFTLHGRPRLRAIRPAFLHFTVKGPDGRPASFTPWYGALAHAIFFRSGSLDYFHTHVCAPGASGCTSVLGATKVTGTSAKPGTLNVGVLVPVPGTWRLFLQCRVNGRVLTAPFTLQV